MKRLLLEILRVPERPRPSVGEEPLSVFRASRRYLGYSAVRWGWKQLGAAAGIVFSLALLDDPDLSRFAPLQSVAERIEPVSWGLDLLEKLTSWGPAPVLWTLEGIAIGAFLVQFVVSGALLSLGWEMRWYLISDTTIRIREGLWVVKEQTMTIANLQDIQLKQGILQRLFRIADLEVRTAGGGGKAEGADPSKGGHQDLHVGHLRGIENAWQLRDRLRASLAAHRDTGLGDSDDLPAAEGEAGAEASELLDPATAAAELLAESRRLRKALESRLAAPTPAVEVEPAHGA